MWAAHLGAQIWPWCVEPPDVGWKMGTPSAWWGTHQRLNDHQILQKSCQRLLGKGFFLPKTVRIDGFLRENSWRDNAAAGLLGFCLNFILLGKKNASLNPCKDVLQEGSSGVVVLCGTVSIFHPFLGLHLPSVGCVGGDPSPPLPKEGQKILPCCPV